MSDGPDTMATRWSITSFVVLALLGCLVEMDVEAAPQSDSTAKTPWRQQNPSQNPWASNHPNPQSPPLNVLLSKLSNTQNPSNPSSNIWVPNPPSPQNPSPNAWVPNPPSPQNPSPNVWVPKPQNPSIPSNPSPNPWVPKPQNPSIPSNPSPNPWVPKPQNPSIPSNPSPNPWVPNPQNPSMPSNPSPNVWVPKPQNPSIPSNPSPNPWVPKPQNPSIPSNPSPNPWVPKPQNPSMPLNPSPNVWLPTSQNPGNPQNPQQPSQSMNTMHDTPQSWPPGNQKLPQNPSRWVHTKPQNPSTHPSNPLGSSVSVHPQTPWINPKKPENPQIPKKTPFTHTAGDQSANRPQISQQPQVLPSYEDKCNVDYSVRVPCGVSGINADDCHGLGCCYNSQQCYFGNAVTVQCTKDGLFIVVVGKDATVPRVDTDTITMQGQGPDCSCVASNSAFAIYQFPVTACGTLVMEESGAIVYENRMSSSFEVVTGPHGTITRDTIYELQFQCRYRGESTHVVIQETIRDDDLVQSVAAYGPFRVAMRLGNGQCHSKGCNPVNAAYNSFYSEADYPVSIVLKDPVYVDVLIVDKSNPNYVLTLDRCWATTCADAHSMPQWDILINGCPNVDDNHWASLVSVPANLELAGHCRRFVFKMFRFVEQTTKHLKQELYIHCTAAVCVPSSHTSCEPVCMSRRRRDVSGVEQNRTDIKMVASSGPLIISAPPEE